MSAKYLGMFASVDPGPVHYIDRAGQAHNVRAEQLGSVITADLLRIRPPPQREAASVHLRLLEEEIERTWESFDTKATQLLAGSVALFAATTTLNSAEPVSAPSSPGAPCVGGESSMGPHLGALFATVTLGLSLWAVWKVLRTYNVVQLNVAETLVPTTALSDAVLPETLVPECAELKEILEGQQLVYLRARVQRQLDREKALSLKADGLRRSYVFIGLQVLLLVVIQLFSI
jgi:hypothetical protein